MLSEPDHRNPFVPLIILASAVAVFFGRILFTHTYLLPWDFREFHLPLAAALYDGIKGTGSLQWDTTTYCGRPLFADPQAQVFYPPTILAVAVATFFHPSQLAYVLEWALVLHVFAAGVFTYLLLRRMGHSTAASVCGGLVFQLSGFFASQAQHVGAIEAAAWMPLMWTAVWQLRREFVSRWFGVLVLAGAMSLLAGFNSITCAAIVSAVLFSVLLSLFRQSALRSIVVVLAGFVAAAGASAIMLWPAAQLALLSVARYRSDWNDGAGFPLAILKSLILPPAREQICDLIYCGIGGLCLAIIAIVSRGSRRLTLPVLSLTLLSGLWMFGTRTHYGIVLWSILPNLVKGSLYPYFAMAPFCLGIAVLAGIGLDRMNRLSLATKYLVAVIVAADLIVVGSGRPMNASDVRKEPGITREQIDGSAATLLRLRQLTAGQPPSRIDTHEGIMALSTTAPLTRIPTANGYNPLVLERLIQVRLCFAKGYRWGAWYEVENIQSPVVDLLNIRYLVTRKPMDTGQTPSRFELRAALPGMWVYENSAVLPRFFMVHKVRPVRTAEEAFAFMPRPEFVPAKLAVVEAWPPEASLEQLRLNTEAAAPQTDPEEEVRVLDYGEQAITLAVRAIQPAFLVTSEVYYPGWRAWMDGRETAVHITDGAFRGVAVPAGTHTIIFRFGADVMYPGIALTTLSICITLAALRRFK